MDNIYKDSSKDATILYACALEAQKTGQKGQVLSAMQRVLDRYNFESPPDVYLPALLRYDEMVMVTGAMHMLNKPDVQLVCS